MPRVLCLAQSHGAAKQPRSRSARKPQTFTLLERVPLRLAAHKPVWDALRKHAARLSITDADHPEEAFSADVIMIDQLGSEALTSIVSVLAERRTMLLAAEKDIPASDVLGKRLDRTFEQELEWLLIRNLLAAALQRTVGSRPAKRGRMSARALLLIDA